ncbi:unnamed protein product [Amoebophrya sp. A120]|nr:unnamed protein product [Amoebophrya sp. A120]|eukprot:GSA120T00003493001.1
MRRMTMRAAGTCLAACFAWGFGPTAVRAAGSYLDLVSTQPDDVRLEEAEYSCMCRHHDGPKFFSALTLDGQRDAEKTMFARGTEDLWNVIKKHAGLQTELLADVVLARARNGRTIPGVAPRYAEVLLDSAEYHANRLFKMQGQEDWERLARMLARLGSVLANRNGIKLRPGVNDGALAYTYKYTCKTQFKDSNGPFSVWVMKNMANILVSGSVYDKAVWNKGKESQTLIIIHEAAHCVLECTDHVYGHGLNGGYQGLIDLPHDQAFANADSFAYFVTLVVWDLIKAGNEDDLEYAQYEDNFECVPKGSQWWFGLPRKGFRDQEEATKWQSLLPRMMREHLRPETCTKRSPKDIGLIRFPPVPHALRSARHRREPPQPDEEYDFGEHIEDSIKYLRFLSMNWESVNDPNC